MEREYAEPGPFKLAVMEKEYAEPGPFKWHLILNSFLFCLKVN